MSSDHSQIELTQHIIQELLNYNPETGLLRWRVRDRKWFTSDNLSNRKSNSLCKLWNDRYPSTVAGALDSAGYLNIRVLGGNYKSHRIIWLFTYDEWPLQVDHINQIKSDNRIINLRSVTNLENGKNQKLHSTNTSGVVGVTWDKLRKNWRAQITHKYKKINLGSFTDIEDAITARQQAEIKFNFHPNHGSTPDA